MLLQEIVLSEVPFPAGFVRVMESLESHGILSIDFIAQPWKVLKLKFGSWKVMEKQIINFLRMNRRKKKKIKS